MNPHLDTLHAYPFERLAALKAQVLNPPATRAHIALSIGEPQHPPPPFLIEALHVRISLTALLAQCVEAAERLRGFLRTYPS